MPWSSALAQLQRVRAVTRSGGCYPKIAKDRRGMLATVYDDDAEL